MGYSTANGRNLPMNGHDWFVPDTSYTTLSSAYYYLTSCYYQFAIFQIAINKIF